MSKPSPPSNHRQVLQDLKGVARRDKADFLPGFFQAYPGGYGEGDKFLGVVVPDQRKIARQYRDLARPQVAKLLESPWHECRLTALFILVDQFSRACHGKTRSKSAAQEIVEFYLEHLDGVNNWDLVDSSAHKILGRWLLENPQKRKILHRLARSKRLWDQRVAVIATLPLIHAGEFEEILTLAEKWLQHPHDLMHKAIGWMLREMGKQNLTLLREFLDQHVEQMPRTMLRYAIEKMSATERQRWLKR